jgi:LIM domain
LAGTLNWTKIKDFQTKEMSSHQLLGFNNQLSDSTSDSSDETTSTADWERRNERIEAVVEQHTPPEDLNWTNDVPSKGLDPARPMWSYVNNDLLRRNGRKYSLPNQNIVKKLTDPDYQTEGDKQMVISRSNSVPGSKMDMQAAQWAVREKNVKDYKSLLETLMTDLDQLMSKVDKKTEVKQSKIMKPTQRISRSLSPVLEIPPKEPEISRKLAERRVLDRRASLRIAAETRRKSKDTLPAPNKVKEETPDKDEITFAESLQLRRSSKSAIRNRIFAERRKQILNDINIEEVAVDKPTLISSPVESSFLSPYMHSQFSPATTALSSGDVEDGCELLPEEDIFCHGCGEIIFTDREKYLEATGHSFHTHCFRCQVCARVLSYKEPFWQDMGRTKQDGTPEGGVIMCQQDYYMILENSQQKI